MRTAIKTSVEARRWLGYPHGVRPHSAGCVRCWDVVTQYSDGSTSVVGGFKTRAKGEEYLARLRQKRWEEYRAGLEVGA